MRVDKGTWRISNEANGNPVQSTNKEIGLHCAGEMEEYHYLTPTQENMNYLGNYGPISLLSNLIIYKRFLKIQKNRISQILNEKLNKLPTERHSPKMCCCYVVMNDINVNHPCVCTVSVKRRICADIAKRGRLESVVKHALLEKTE